MVVEPVDDFAPLVTGAGSRRSRPATARSKSPVAGSVVRRLRLGGGDCVGTAIGRPISSARLIQTYALLKNQPIAGRPSSRGTTTPAGCTAATYENDHEAEQHAGDARVGVAEAALSNSSSSGRADPDQVVHPGDRADQTADDAGEREAGHLVAGGDRPADPDDPDRQDHRDRRRATAAVLGSAALRRATAPLSDWFEMNASAPTRSVFHNASVQNTRRGVRRERRRDERRGGGGGARHERGPPPLGDQQVDDEDARGQLDRGGQADADAAEPAASG